jgi:hypothetical protein
VQAGERRNGRGGVQAAECAGEGVAPTLSGEVERPREGRGPTNMVRGLGGGRLGRERVACGEAGPPYVSRAQGARGGRSGRTAGQRHGPSRPRGYVDPTTACVGEDNPHGGRTASGPAGKGVSVDRGVDVVEKDEGVAMDRIRWGDGAAEREHGVGARETLAAPLPFDRRGCHAGAEVVDVQEP